MYSTYLGGSDRDGSAGIIVDADRNAYVTGYTASTNFPTAHAIQGSNGGGYDVFITKINAAGSALAYSTYLGGSSLDQGAGIAVDTDRNAYVTGYTYSTNFPTKNAIQGSFGGIYDAFVTKTVFFMANKPTVKTKSATKVTNNSATLNGTVNAHGSTTSAWFQYGKTSGSYTMNSSKKRVKGSTDKNVSIGISGLTSHKKYYYRIAAKNKDGTTYGDEKSFTTK